MSETAVRVKENKAVALAGPAASDALISRLAGLLPGFSGEPASEALDAATALGGLAQGQTNVDLCTPSLRVRSDESDWDALLSDPKRARGRKALLAHIRALLEVNASARKKGVTLLEETRFQARHLRAVTEKAWVTLLEQNKTMEASVRPVMLFLRNLGDSAEEYQDRIRVVDIAPQELATPAGRALLSEEMSKYAHRPDPRGSYAFVNVVGSVGSPSDLVQLAKVVDTHRAVLITDGPAYTSLESLRAAAAPGGVLESYAGTETHHRHLGLIANLGRARKRFVGQSAEEKSDVFVPLSSVWLAMYLRKIAQGQPWNVAAGYSNPILGISGVSLDLRLKENSFDYYLRHLVNPVIRLAAGSEKVVLWGPYTVYKSRRGLQIGVAVVETLLVRYAEWIVNQYGLLNDLEEARDVVEKKLSAFLTLNSGAGKTFRSGSRVYVSADQDKRELIVEFQVNFREVAERAVIRVAKPAKREESGRVSARSV